MERQQFIYGITRCNIFCQHEMMESKIKQNGQIIFPLISPVFNHYDNYISLREFLLVMTVANGMITPADHTRESTAAVPSTKTLSTCGPTAPPAGTKLYMINK